MSILISVSKFFAIAFASIIDPVYYYGWSFSDLSLWNWFDAFVVALPEPRLSKSYFMPLAYGVALMYILNLELKPLPG